MGVSNQDNEWAIVGDGVTAVIYFDNIIYAASDMILSKDGVPLVLTTDYSIPGGSINNPAGGQINLVVPPALGAKVKAVSNVAQTQGNGGPFDTTAIVLGLDRLTRLVQQMGWRLARTLRIADTDVQTGALPAASPLSTLAGQLLALDNSNPPKLVPGGVATPAPTAALNIPRVNAAATAYELRTPAQTLTDIGGDNASNLVSGTVPTARLAAMLQSLLGLASAANTFGYFSAANTFTLATLTAFGRSVMAAADAAALRVLAGLGSIATQAASAVAITGGSIDSATVTSLPAPSAAADAATKGYVDAAVTGLGKRGRVRVASTANLVLSGAQTIDGVAAIAGDLVLAKDQTTQANNGIYVCAAGAWARDVNYDTWVEIEGCLIAIEEGSTNADTLWLCTSNSGGTLGVTAITFSKVAPGSGGTVTNITASNGIKTTSGLAITSTGNVEMDIAGLAAKATPDLTADYVPIHDAAGNAVKKVLLSKISPIVATTAMLFVQASAPTGWTKQTTHNDKALRVVSGTPGTGGSTAFSSVMASRTPTGTIAVNSVTLSTANLAAHTHAQSANTVLNTAASGSNPDGCGTTHPSGGTTGSNGSGTAFTPTGSFTGVALDFAVAYVDVMIATKD